jgi:branched-chain amino acid transport system ATP-binding protein
MNSTAILQLKNVSKYFGSLAAVDNINFEIVPGEIFGIAGPNGSGKTTLINIITHTLPPSSGEIHFNGQSIQNLRAYKICRLGIARTFQNPEIFKSLPAIDNVVLGATHGLLGGGKTKRSEHVTKILNFVGLSKKKDVTSKNLIISEKKKLMLAVALSTNPKLLILDEPCSGLTSIESKEMISLIKEINKKDITVMIIEHNMKVLMSISDRVMIMNHGENICEDTPDNVCKNDQIIDIYLGQKYRKEGNA